MNLERLTRISLKWSYFRKIYGVLISGIVFIFLVRELAPTAFGLIAYASVVVVLIEVFIDHGFFDAVVQRENLTDSTLHTIFWIQVLLGLFFIVIVIINRNFIASFLSEKKLAPILGILSLDFIIVGSYKIPYALLRKEMNFKHLSFVQICAETISGVVALSMAFNGFGVWSLVARNLIDEFTKLTGYLYFCDWVPKFSFDLENTAALYSFSLPNMGSHYMGYLRDKLDDFLIGFFLGSSSLGIYSVAYRIFTLSKTVITRSASDISYPLFSKRQNDLGKLRDIFLKGIRLQSFLSFPVYASIAVITPHFVPVAFGPTWQTAVPLLIILCLFGCLESLVFHHENLLLALDKPEWRFLIRLTKVIINTTVILAVIEYGVIYVLLGIVTSEIIQFPLIWCISKSLINFSFQDYVTRLGRPFLFLTLVTSVGFLLHVLMPVDPFVKLITITTIVIILGTIVIRYFLPSEIQAEILKFQNEKN